MLFNSFEFLIFLPLVFILYWFFTNNNLKVQNLLLLVASYIFYGWWDWRFLSLIFISSIVDFIIGINLEKIEKKKTRVLLLCISLLLNLGFLGFFKYYNFFVDSFVHSFGSIGISLHARTLNIILPVGISFYTFQTLSYTIDVFQKKIKPSKNIIAFFAFVSFFPQLVAGPIERAKNLLPQFEVKRTFDYDKAIDGLRQILWGLFKKIVIADSCATRVDEIFSNYTMHDGSVLLLGVFYFAFQIYGDFSGYSDIAIGTARLFGFKLMRNFAFPYFSRDITEFWRRWHISLSTWFRDYVYIPLGGSYVNKWKQFRNVLIIFTVSGFWHGANWTFIIWGLLNGLYCVPLMLSKKNKKNTKIVAENSFFPSFTEVFQMLSTFFLVLIAWVFFRAESVQQAFSYLANMFSLSLFKIPGTSYLQETPLIFLLLIIEWFQRKKQHGFEFDHVPIVTRRIIYMLFIFMILIFFNEKTVFIYFQF